MDLIQLIISYDKNINKRFERSELKLMNQMENVNMIGANIEELLYLKRKKQAWLAEQCGVTPSHINQIIKGKTKPSLQVLKVIAATLEVTTDEIISKNHSGVKEI